MSQQHNDSTTTSNHINTDLELGSTKVEPKAEANTMEDTNKTEEKAKSNPTKLIIGGLFLALVTYIIVDSFTAGYVRQFVQSFLNWFESNIYAGSILFIAVYAILTVFLIPGSLLTLGAGFVFASALDNLWLGVAIGSVVVLAGAASGAIAAFLVGRYLLRESTAKLAEKYTLFQAVDSALKEQGLKIFTLLRLSPIAPFTVMNYIGGVSAVTLRDYTLALLGMIPGTAVYVFFGASAGSLASGDGSNRTVTIIIAVVGSILGVAAILLTTRYAKQELNRILEEKKEAEGEGADGDEEQFTQIAL